MKKHGEELIYSGSWIIAVGTVIAALGVTQETMTGEEQGKELVAKGSAIEAFGNTFQALGNTALFLDEKRQSSIQTIIGCWLQAGGNSTIAIGTEIEIHESEDEGLRLNAIGSGVQSLGAAFQASGAAEAELSITRNLEVASENLTTLGALLESIGSIFLLSKKDLSGVRLSLIGSWIQVVASFLEVYTLTFATDSELK